MKNAAGRPLVLVTGADGFIGSRCVIALMDRGYRVRCAVRTAEHERAIRPVLSNHAKNARPDSLSFVTLDLTEDNGWDDAMAGCTYVLHVASPIMRRQPRQLEHMTGPARTGTRRALRAAARAGVKRLVLTSSVVAVSHGRDGRPQPFVEEEWGVPDPAKATPYTISKILAERDAWEFHETDRSGLELTVVNPGLVFGPVLHSRYGTSPDIVRRFMKGWAPAIPAVGYPLCDVRDVADAHIAAMERPEAAGERFICADEFFWLSDIGAALRSHFPDYAHRMPNIPLPKSLALAASRFDGSLHSLIVDIGQYRSVSSQKAARILDWTPRPARDSVIATAESMIELGLV